MPRASAISRATRDAVRASGGRPIAKDRLHLTVAFLGELTAAGLDVARQRAADRGRARSSSTLDALGIWPESKILWLAPSRAARRARRARSAASGTRSPSAAFAARSATYRPHVTLARRARPDRGGRRSPFAWARPRARARRVVSRRPQRALRGARDAGRCELWKVLDKTPVARFNSGDEIFWPKAADFASVGRLELEIIFAAHRLRGASESLPTIWTTHGRKP